MRSQVSYRVVPDRRRQSSLEVYSIDTVEGGPTSGASQVIPPFLTLEHDADHGRFWYAVREEQQSKERRWSEVRISLVDLGFSPESPPDWVLRLKLTCFNRDLPAQLHVGPEGEPVQLREGSPVRARLITKPTSVVRPSISRDGMWRLLSHLNLNHLSITDAEAFREILRLNEFRGSTSSKARIDAIKALSHEPEVMRVGDGVARGIALTVTINAEEFPDEGAHVFLWILSVFIGAYCGINTYSKLRVVDTHGELVGAWRPRAGNTTLM